MTRGGHFAAFEQPEILAGDIFQFTKELNSPRSASDMFIVPRSADIHHQ